MIVGFAVAVVPVGVAVRFSQVVPALYLFGLGLGFDNIPALPAGIHKQKIQ